MSFRFPLETLLRFRRSLEQQEERKLELANQRVASVKRQIEALDMEAAERVGRSLRDLTAGSYASELHFDLHCREVFAVKRTELERHLAQAEKHHDECRTSYQQARTRSEAVDTLRVQQFEDYQRDQQRRDQRRLDDQFLLRREYLRKR